MGQSRVRYPEAPRHPDGTTHQPTHYRVWKEAVPEDEAPWYLDGVDDVGRFTDDSAQYWSAEEAWAALPDFAHYNPLTSTTTAQEARAA